jgi:hypothetical protein
MCIWTNSTIRSEQKRRPFGHSSRVSLPTLSRSGNVTPNVVEEWKWNAPSFSYEGAYLATFNLWEKRRIHLVFHNPEITKLESPLPEGDDPTRRMADLLLGYGRCAGETGRVGENSGTID